MTDSSASKAQALVHKLGEDLHRLDSGDTTPELVSDVATSLATLQRQIKSAETLAQREMNQGKRQMAKERLAGLSQQYTALSAAFARYRSQRKQAENASQRDELFARPGKGDAGDGAAASTTIPIDRELLMRESIIQARARGVLL
eukprot:Unigene13469_Nuclearia_a/m.40828 Unigene13469_Nuclearia_a/g.40828  ORF Unigene13469_Nuclearia_a/g.40828 Unigene13469_Nuclearia_a/m.40828 type:complete len:145 (+) Unigene13469_Nuclearia_a:14-448(+)